MEETRKEQWYYKPWMIVLAILCCGPLGLLPLWFRPRTNIYIKIIVSVAVIAITVSLTIMTANVVKDVMALYQELGELLK